MTKSEKPLKVETRILVGRKVYTVKSSRRTSTGITVYDTFEGLLVPASEIRRIIEH